MPKRVQKGGFQRTLQNSIFLYALIPLLALVTVIMALTHHMLYRFVENELQNSLTRTATVIDQVESHYLQAFERLASDPALADALQRRVVSTQLYEEIYSIVNKAPIKCDFYLLDAERVIVGSSLTITPPYLTRDGLATNQLWQRLKRSEDGMAIAGSESVDSGLLMVTEVRSRERVCGYLLFDLPRESAFAALAPDCQMILSDRFRRVVWATDETLLNGHNRVASEYGNVNGLFWKGSRQLLLLRRHVFHGQLELCVYADTTFYNTVYHVLMLALPSIFLLLTPLLFYAARRVARKNGQAVDKIAAAMQNTRYDTLTQSLEMNTGDEFEEIAASYEKMCRDMRKLIDNNAESAKQQVISELKQLEAQFNPHFLFNTLETIRVLIKLEPEAANRAIVALSELLRYSVNNTIRDVPLVEDMHYTEAYLQIQKCRLQNKLDYAFDVCSEVGQCQVPKLVVQPLVENAVKYGVDAQGYCNVTIRAFRQGDALRIEVTDRGCALTPAQVEQILRLMNEPANTSAHNGLYNIHKRLRLAFGKDYGIELTSFESGDGNCFAAVLPIREDEKDG